MNSKKYRVDKSFAIVFGTKTLVQSRMVEYISVITSFQKKKVGEKFSV